MIMPAGLMLEVPDTDSRHIKEFSMKDHLSENVRRLRQIQRQCKQREAEAVKPVKVLWKSEKYKEVQSKIKQERENPPPTPRPASANFLRAHSRSGPLVKLESRPCSPDVTHKVSVPPASIANDIKLVRHDIDFIQLNGRNARHAQVPRSASVTALDTLRKKNEETLDHYNMGEVPKYLINRKKNWRKEEEERIANTPDPAMPPGHRQLPEKERQETLSLLQTKEKELVQQLAALPIGTDTMRVRNMRKEIESKLTELEEAIKIFSRPKVFVRIDP